MNHEHLDANTWYLCDVFTPLSGFPVSRDGGVTGTSDRKILSGAEIQRREHCTVLCKILTAEVAQ